MSSTVSTAAAPAPDLHVGSPASAGPPPYGEPHPEVSVPLLFLTLSACLTTAPDDPEARAARQLQQLEALGYLGGDAASDEPTPSVEPVASAPEAAAPADPEAEWLQNLCYCD